MTEKPIKVPKEWGYELWLANNLENNYCGKILHVNAGSRFSMHFHRDKHETFYVQNGECELNTIDTQTAKVTTVSLSEGDTVEIDRHVPHQIVAKTEVDIIELSTYHRDSDSYRVWRD